MTTLIETKVRDPNEYGTGKEREHSYTATEAERSRSLMTARPVPAPAISMRGVERSSGKLEVLSGVDRDVERGSIFALLGSNGAGTTTAVRILATLLRADAGTEVVNGFVHPSSTGPSVDQSHGAVRGRGQHPQRETPARS